MAFVQLSKISLAFGDRDILKNVNLVLANGTKAALTGANGCGKSTLMKIAAGLIQPDTGEISHEKDTVLAYLPQSGIVHRGKTLKSEAEMAFAGALEVLQKMDAVASQMAETKDTAKQNTLAQTYHDLQTKLDASRWHERSRLIEETLCGLGFSTADFERPTQAFSGGWQMRIALAKVLLQNADIVILDEPTNYLDIEARTWLEERLKRFGGGFLLVSHDRYFLDQCVKETYELFNGELKKYKGSYTAYEKVRQTEMESLVKAYTLQKEEIAKTEDFIRKFRYNASKAALVQDRIRKLEKLERIEIPEHLKKIHFRFPNAPHSGNIVLRAQGISKSYGTRAVIDNFDLTVEKKERLVLAGRNGAGKSTLLRILAGQDTAFSGSVQKGAGVQMGYFSQEEGETLSGSETVIQLIENTAPLDLIPKVRDMLAAFLFRGDDIYKSVSVLSGGEKSRLALLRLLLKPLNLLILDEPTNHLDLHSKDVLADALQHFDGTLIFVSHDKDFIQNLATRVLELQAPAKTQGASRIRNYPGSYDYYLSQIAKENGTASSFDGNSGSSGKTASSAGCGKADSFGKVGSVPLSGSADADKILDSQKDKSASPISGNAQSGKKAKALSYEEQKQRNAQKRKLEKEEQRLLSETGKIEAEIAENEALLAQPHVYTDGIKSKAVQQKITELKKYCEELSEQWADVAEKLNAY